MVKKVYIESVGSEVTIARRKGTRNLRLSIRSDGQIRLSVPYGLPERHATKFIEDKSEWIKKHTKPQFFLKDGMHIGKAHRIKFNWTLEDKIRTRIKNNEIIISVPSYMSENDNEVQQKTLTACERALKNEAVKLLPQRVDFLSKKHHIEFNNLKVKKLKSRWGSCDNNKNIILNTYLMQLDWSLIDYVILHELAHTKHQHHQADFWNFLSEICPRFKELRKQLKTHPTNIFATNF